MKGVGLGLLLGAALWLSSTPADGSCYPVVGRTYNVPVVSYVAPAPVYAPPTYPLYIAAYYQDDAEIRVLKAELRATNAELRALRAEMLRGLPRFRPEPGNGNGDEGGVLPGKASRERERPETSASLTMCAACHEAAVAKTKGGGHSFFKKGEPTFTPEQRGQAIEEVSTRRMPKGMQIADADRLRIINELVGAKEEGSKGGAK
jgi:hypothetical protein